MKLEPLHVSILHEIVRVIEARSRVPERVKIEGADYQLTYLEDHKHRIEQAIQRRDNQGLNMLYGQLASLVKYQLLRKTRRASRKTAAAKAATPSRTKKAGAAVSRQSKAGKSGARTAAKKPAQKITRTAKTSKARTR